MSQSSVKPARRSARRRVSRNNVDTRELILAAARKTLTKGGSAAFSLRRVADAAGITVGNLTYHFPSKRALMRSLIDLLLDEYSCGFEQQFAQLPTQPDRALERLLAWLMQEAAISAAGRALRELWAMALHDRAVARMVDDSYERAIENVAMLLQKSDPTLAASDARELAYLVAIFSDGTNVLYGTRRKRPVALERLTEVAATVIVSELRARHPAIRESGHKLKNSANNLKEAKR